MSKIKEMLIDVASFLAYWRTVKFQSKSFFVAALAAFWLAMAGALAPWTDTNSFNTRIYQEAILDVMPLGGYQIVWFFILGTSAAAVVTRNYLAFWLSSVLITALSVSYTWSILWAKLTTDIPVSWVAVALWNAVIYYGFACILLDEKVN